MVHSDPASERYSSRTRCSFETACTSALVVAGSGRTAARSGAASAYWRTAAAWAATPSGSALIRVPSARPTGSSGLAAAWWPSSTAITRPSASVALNTSGGSRSPRPSR